MPPAPSPPPAPLRRTLVRAAYTALALFLGRAALFFAMERLGHGAELPRARLRLAVAAPDIALASAAVGLAAAALGTLAHALAARARLVRALAALLAVAVATALFHALFTGLLGEASRRIGWQTPRGAQVHRALAGVALACAAALYLLRRRPLRPRLVAALPAALLLAGAPFALRALWRGLPPLMPVREVQLDLPASRAPFEVLAARADAPPGWAVIAPSLDYEIDGGDMPALVLPPPARVRVELGGFEGTLWLTARAGLDHTAFAGGGARTPAGARVAFSLAHNGQRVFAGERAVESLGFDRGVESGTAWLDATGELGLPVHAGDVLELSTELLGAPAGAPPLACGFGGLTLERRTTARREPSSPERPNVVLVVMDTQRADRLSLHGYGRATSPRLDALAAGGTVYEQAHSTSSWTWPSTASLLTGLHPEEHGVRSERSCYLASSLDTLAEALQRAGYTTAGFSANPLVVPAKNFDQGFESFEHGRGAFRQSELVVPGVLEWLEAAAGTRFFLYVHLVDPHVPYVPSREARAALAPDAPADFNPYAIAAANQRLRRGEAFRDDGTFDVGTVVPPAEQRAVHEMYDACVLTGDAWLGRLVDRVEELGLADETVFAYTSDHGEELFEHGLAEHGKQLYQELVHVPLVLWGPGIPAGVRVREPVSNVHLTGTLAAVGRARLDLPEPFLDLARPDAARSGAPPVFFSTELGWWNRATGQTIHGLRRGDLVLQHAPAGAPFGRPAAGEGGDWRLHDLSSDPLQRRDLAAERPQVARELLDEVRARAAELTARRRSAGVAAGEETLELLHGIGYLGD